MQSSKNDEDANLMDPDAVGMSRQKLSELDSVVQGHVGSGKIQGAVVAVSRYGKPVYFEAHGYSDLNTKTPMKLDSMFQMASSTKPVTGVAAMIAMEKGLFEADHEVQEFISSFSEIRVAVLADPEAKDISPKFVWPSLDKNGKTPGRLLKLFGRIYGRLTKKYYGYVPSHRTVGVKRPVTIHDLLTHTSGLGSFGLGTAVSDWNKKPWETHLEQNTLASHVEDVAKGPLDFQPGSRWMYSPGTGLDVVARIIEITSGQPFNEFVQENIFDPLDMKDTHWKVPLEKYSRVVVIRGDKDDWKKQISYYSGSYGLISTARDFLHFQEMLANGGELLGNRIVNLDSVTRMSSNQVGSLYYGKAKRGDDTNSEGFGYTVSITLDSENSSIPHGNGAFGWGGAAGTYSWSEPASGIAAVIMVQQPSKEVPFDIAKVVQDSIVD